MNKILIVGLGLMGGSYAEALTKAGYEVGAVTRKQATIDKALGMGLIAHGTTEVTREYISQFDTVVFALYPHILIEWLEKYQDFIRDGAMITDVTGVKSAVVYKVQEMLRPGLEFVGAHPMAGREASGLDYADASVFQGANYIVTPTAANTEEAIRACEELGRILGFSRISRLDPARHDEMIGFLSQLAHCIAVSLMTCRDDTEELAAYTGNSFRDLTRIARINDEMWSELFTLNRDTLLDQIDIFTGQLRRLRTAIADGDTETIRAMMRLADSRRALFDKK